MISQFAPRHLDASAGIFCTPRYLGKSSVRDDPRYVAIISGAACKSRLNYYKPLTAFPVVQATGTDVALTRSLNLGARFSTNARAASEYRKYKRSSLPISSLALGEECVGATGRATEMRGTYLQLPRTSVLVTTALAPRAAIGRADPLPGHRTHGIRVYAVERVALSEPL